MRLTWTIVSLMFMTNFAFGETINVGRKGGFYCGSPSEIEPIIKSLAEGKKPLLGKSCAALARGVQIASNKATTVGNFSMGIGDVAGTTDSGFATFIDLPQPTSDGRTFKRVSPSDVRNTPNKWAGRDVEFVDVNIYWVDDDDVRVLTPISLTVFVDDIRGADRDYYKQNCETEAEAISRQCRAIVRFKYAEHGEDSPNGILKRTVIKTSDLEVIKPVKRR